jgi:hypothetical protein
MVKGSFPGCIRTFKSIKALNTHYRQAHPEWYKVWGGRKKKK